MFISRSFSAHITILIIEEEKIMGFIIFLNLMDMLHDFLYSPDLADGIADLIHGINRAINSVISG